MTDENDVPVTVTEADGKTSQHPGYYWLAYNWRNLLASCVRCNQPGEEGIGKRNRFPLENPPPHAISEKEIPGEKPLLINPIDPGDDDPETHLGIDLETGLMTFKNNSKRGKMCIDIFGLNKRDQLVQERKTAITEVKAKYVALLMLDDAQAQVIRGEITAMEEGALNYTLARRAQIRKFRERLGL